jgi:hypothetical protein
VVASAISECESNPDLGEKASKIEKFLDEFINNHQNQCRRNAAGNFSSIILLFFASILKKT